MTDTEIKALIERMGTAYGNCDAILDQAATALLSLLAERAALRAQLEDAIRIMTHAVGERDRLRGAAARYIGALDAWDGSPKAESYTERREADLRVAIAAIKEPNSEGAA